MARCPRMSLLARQCAHRFFAAFRFRAFGLPSDSPLTRILQSLNQ